MALLVSRYIQAKKNLFANSEKTILLKNVVGYKNGFEGSIDP